MCEQCSLLLWMKVRKIFVFIITWNAVFMLNDKLEELSEGMF